VSRRKKSGRAGSSFSDYLKGEGRYEETSALAVKRVLAWQLEEAKRMHTSRSQLKRILDPTNDKR
jgi:hypothetical protein